MTPPQRHKLIAAVYLNSRGFGFVLFEGPFAPRDWRQVETRGEEKRQLLLQRIEGLLSRYKPDVLVLQDTSSTGTHRPSRIRRLNETIVEMAEQRGMPIASFSRSQVRERFAYLGHVTKDTIAASIAKRIPAFERFVPPPRKLWQSEDARMGIFDAAALALTFFQDLGTDAVAM